MADQEFLASFGVEIDESGVKRLQAVLEENRTLAEELASSFDNARASVQAFFRDLDEISLPGILKDGLSAAAGLNTPLAMFTVGIYLAQTDLKKMLKDRSLYAVSAVRLLLIPLAALGLLSLFPANLNGMKTVLLIAAACPVGSNVAVYAQLHGKDYPYAVETVVISTLLSIFTIPLMVWLTSFIW